MARVVGLSDAYAETKLAIANYHLGRLSDPQAEAERLDSAPWVSNLDLAELWLAIGEPERAKTRARAAYKWAWADGEPYVRRYQLNRAADLLTRLGVPIPELPPYDPSKDEKFPWEEEVLAAIERLRAEKAAKSGESG